MHAETIFSYLLPPASLGDCFTRKPPLNFGGGASAPPPPPKQQAPVREDPAAAMDDAALAAARKKGYRKTLLGEMADSQQQLNSTLGNSTILGGGQ